MPTPAERQALVFFAAVAALGIGVNAWRAARGGDAVIAGSPGELAAQIARVDSAVASSPSRELRRKKQGERASARGRERPAASSPTNHPPPTTSLQPPTARDPVDLDYASIAAVESLPRIGPALAHRIVANRDSFGAFGSIEGLQRVRGIGPAIAKSLRAVVAFSGVPRPGAPTGVVKGRRRRSAP